MPDPADPVDPALEPAAEDATDRLDLHRPRPSDLAELHAILADPAVWRHYPSLRHDTVERTEATLARWSAGWEQDGLGTWIVRERGSGAVIGYGGCSMLGGVVWNLGYRFATTAQGRGYATELARHAIEQAHAASPATPVVAYLVEHNAASAAVAAKVGLELVHRAPDAGNPDPSVVRLVLADRPLTDAQLGAVLR